MNALWQDEANKVGPNFATMFTAIIDSNTKLGERMAALENRDATAEAAITRLLSGFPGGDFEGHRRYHESVIEWRELRNKMVREALINAAKAGSLGAMGWIVYALWQAAKISVKQ